MHHKFSCTYYNASPKGNVHPSSKTTELLTEFRRIQKLHQTDYPSHNELVRLPLDTKVLEQSKSMAEKYYTSDLKYIIVIGIGGSNLGTKALYDALRGQYDLLSHVGPKMLFLDTVSSSSIEELLSILERDIHHKEEVLINLVSKSGSTTESIVNFEILYSALSGRVDGISARIVCTTDEHSPLWNFAKEKDFGVLPIPKMVGGRYSVFSSVGLFPLMLAGIDVVSFRQGATDMLNDCLDADVGKQHARRAAEILFGEMKNGVSILNVFHFNPELESLGKWERQLTAESLGKEKDLNGKKVYAGITPIVSIGSTDLHSMAQLYFGGPRDKFTMLIKADAKTLLHVPSTPLSEKLVTGIDSKRPVDIMNAIFHGVMGAYRKNELPFAEVHLSELSPYTIGAYMQWRMLTVIHLASLMHIDPFDQPNVEDYKEGTRQVLLNNR